MFSSTLVCLSLLSSAFAIQVTRPSLTQGWTNKGAQTVSWDRVSTDATNFSVVLTNLDRKILATDVVLVALVDAQSASTVSVPEPSGGWPTIGGSYRVNLVKSSTEQTTIYAQSSEFNITAGTGTTSGTTSGTVSTAGAASTGTAAGTSGSKTGSTTGSTTDSSNSTTSDSQTAPNMGNGASTTTLAAGLFTGVVALLGASLL
ncbi:hypothetical protein D9611_002563 [Ephemerocybe angulata]|uniref:Yeast cell wall synthesis Kre9/Knh1-like N-terminal domain-containing protein n=1 Tax=Ephemerocybe angulata TaxID=980116 RepID=A0A8H5FEA3_9AGAR|nr:hypothetical protein D9611_002563 [Tulosesus angulatus]